MSITLVVLSTHRDLFAGGSMCGGVGAKVGSCTLAVGRSNSSSSSSSSSMQGGMAIVWSVALAAPASGMAVVSSVAI